ncbi:MAG: 50S ribosomal protein L21 [Candidatus Aminicenantales bacterium]
MFAVIKTGGKQYLVKEGDVLQVEKFDVQSGQTVDFDQVLLIEDGTTTLIGTPVLEKAVVRAEVIKSFKDEKILVFKKKRRKQFRRTRGHRQQLLEVKIEEIIVDRTTAPKKKEMKAEVKTEEKAALKEKPEKEALPKTAPEEKVQPAERKKEVKKEPKAKEKSKKEAKPKVRKAFQKEPAKKAKPKTKKSTK